MTKRAADGLDEFLELVTQRIAEAEVAGFDETGLRVAGALHWADRPHPHRSALGCGDAQAQRPRSQAA